MYIALKSLPSLSMDSDLVVMKAMSFIMNEAGDHCPCDAYDSVFDKGVFCVTVTLIDGVSILFRLISGDSF